MEAFLQIIIPTLSVVLTTIVTYFFKNIKDKNKQIAANEEALKFGLLALCRDRILQGYRYYKYKGGISTQDFETMTKLYNAYHVLGGNGTITKVFEKINDLPIKEGDI